MLPLLCKQYLVDEYAGQESWLSMLTMALELKSLVIVLDGIDEAGGRKKQIVTFIVDVLVPAGMRVVCTSRPEGVAQDPLRSIRHLRLETAR